MIRRIAGACLACLAAAGCQTGPDGTAPTLDLPAGWNAANDGGPEPERAWWATLRDPVLDDLVARAVEGNLSLRIAASRVREARAARGLAESTLWPTLGLDAGYARAQAAREREFDAPGPLSGGVGLGPGGLTRSATLSNGDASLTRSVTGLGAAAQRATTLNLLPDGDSGFDRVTDTHRLGFDAVWEIDILSAGRVIEIAEAGIAGAQAAHRAALVTLLAEVALNYIEFRGAQARLDITRRNIEAQAGTVRIARARFDAGLNSELDAIRAEALLASTTSQLPMLEAEAAAARHRIAVLIGGFPGGVAPLLDEARPLPAAPETVPVGLPSDLLRRRPDIALGEARFAEAAARVGIARADLYPKFSLTGALGAQSADLGDLLTGGSRIWSFGPSVSWPFLQGGRVRANIQVRERQLEQAALAFEEQVLMAVEEVENGLVSYAQEQRRLAELDRAVEANAAAVRLANERYLRGLEDFLSVLQAQQQVYIAEDARVQSGQYALASLVRLYKALGGGWEAFETETPGAE